MIRTPMVTTSQSTTLADPRVGLPKSAGFVFSGPDPLGLNPRLPLVLLQAKFPPMRLFTFDLDNQTATPLIRNHADGFGPVIYFGFSRIIPHSGVDTLNVVMIETTDGATKCPFDEQLFNFH
jgi:hypothetical protein